MRQIDFQFFRNNLKTLRLAKDLTAKDLSERAGLRQLKRISDLEGGKGLPSLDEVYSISLALDISMCDLLFKELKIIVQ